VRREPPSSGLASGGEAEPEGDERAARDQLGPGLHAGPAQRVADELDERDHAAEPRQAHTIGGPVLFLLAQVRFLHEAPGRALGRARSPSTACSLAITVGHTVDASRRSAQTTSSTILE
jgi:hypothetical protein